MSTFFPPRPLFSLPVSYQSFVDLVNKKELAKFGLQTGGSFDKTLIASKLESLALASAQDKAYSDDYFLFVVSDNDFITTNGHQAAEVSHKQAPSFGGSWKTRPFESSRTLLPRKSLLRLMESTKSNHTQTLTLNRMVQPIPKFSSTEFLFRSTEELNLATTNGSKSFFSYCFSSFLLLGFFCDTPAIFALLCSYLARHLASISILLIWKEVDSLSVSKRREWC